jgi:uncharacterized protein YecE (DUF72 family)
MGKIRVGTASWTDRTLLASGWYPADANSPEKRLEFYASQFPLVEVDATYYAPPAEQTAAAWAARTPKDFTFNIKAYSLLTGHPTKVASLFKDLRPETDKPNIYPKDLPPQALEEVWTRFLSALDPLVQAKKLGVLLFQFPPWFTIRRSNKEYLLEVQKRCSPLRIAVEFRTSLVRRRQPPRRWSSCAAPAALRLCGHAAGTQVVDPAGGGGDRRHRHGSRPQRQPEQDIHEKFGYRYPNGAEELAPKLRKLADATGETHVLMNNCYSDYAQRNASQLLEMLDG